MLTLEDIKKYEPLRTYIIKADEALSALGFTEHSFAHVTKVSATAAEILKTMGYDPHEIELARIAGYMHDIGNLVNRIDHSQSGAVIAPETLVKVIRLEGVKLYVDVPHDCKQ